MEDVSQVCFFPQINQKSLVLVLLFLLTATFGLILTLHSTLSSNWSQNASKLEEKTHTDREVQVVRCASSYRKLIQAGRASFKFTSSIKNPQEQQAATN